MRCPFCGHGDTQVSETRESDEGDVVRRRRRCQSCDKRFTTYERADIALPMVVKKDGTRAEFDMGKLRASMTLALRKRPVSIEQIDGGRTRMSINSIFPNAEAMEQVLAMGMEEGLKQAVGQIDAILAEDAVRPA